MLSIEFDYSKCNRCYKCVNICCNSKVIEINNNDLPTYKNIHKCISCGHCIAICPQKAILSKNTNPGQKNMYVLNSQEIVKENINIQQVLAGIRSNRFFTDKHVSHEYIQQILDSMISSPSAGNEQNRNYYIYSSPEKVNELEKDMQLMNIKNSKMFSNPLIKKLISASMIKHATTAYKENNIELAKNDIHKLIEKTIESLTEPRKDFFYRKAPAAILVTSDTTKSGIHKSFYKADIAIAITYGAIMAGSLGLYSCRLGLSEILFNKYKSLKIKYGIPKNERIDGILAFGYSDIEWKQTPPRGPSKVIWN